MIVKVRGELIDSNKESVGLCLEKDEIIHIVIDHLKSNPYIVVVNNTRTRSETDVIEARDEVNRFQFETEEYLLKTYPKKFWRNGLNAPEVA